MTIDPGQDQVWATKNVPVDTAWLHGWLLRSVKLYLQGITHQVTLEMDVHAYEGAMDALKDGMVVRYRGNRVFEVTRDGYPPARPEQVPAP